MSGLRKSKKDEEMKDWKNAEIVELNITETANGGQDFFFENSCFDTNPDALNHQDSDGDGNGWCPIHKTPDSKS